MMITFLCIERLQTKLSYMRSCFLKGSQDHFHSNLNEIIETSISVDKTADLLYHIGSLSNNVMLVSYKINKKLQKYGIEFLHKLMCYVRYLLFSIFQINFVAYWLCYLMPSRYAPSLCPFEATPYSKFKFLFWRKNYV